ncbi:hypothetical protein HK105_201074 [Polyrhizophydium stewartii]|uniref:Ankyrin repeat protein n=1 Tax=Polyrhizophydium stewartii TaxID=2732419 RepID=A0ABR4NJ19_9FUNG
MDDATAASAASGSQDPAERDRAEQPVPASSVPPSRASEFRHVASNEWDRLSAEVRHMVLDAAGPLTKLTTGVLVAAELRGLPEKQRERVRQDASDADWRGDLDLLPRIGLSSRSLSLSRRFFERLRSQMMADIADRVAVRNGWMDLVDNANLDDLAVTAAGEGKVEILRDLIDVRRVVTPSTNLARSVGSSGSLDAVCFLHERMSSELWTPSIGSPAANSGNIGLMVWLKEHHPECLGSPALSGAAWGNNLRMVQWVVDNTAAACTPQAIYGAAFHCNFEMLQFLMERFPGAIDVHQPGTLIVLSDVRVIEVLHSHGHADPQQLLGEIIRKGDAAALDWVMDRYQIVPTEFDLVPVHYSAYVELLKRAYIRGVPFSELSAKFAARYCNVQLLNWILSRNGDMISLMIEATAIAGHHSLAEWWRVRHGVVFGQRELELAIASSNDGLACCLLADSSFDCDLESARGAIPSSFPDYQARSIAAIRDAIETAVSRRAKQVAATS